MGAGHVEQFGRFTGTIFAGAEEYQIDTIGNRDHSRGPRVFDSNIRHSWPHGILEDGVMFQLYEAEIAGKVGAAFAEANVVIDGIAHQATAIIHDKLPFTENRGLIRSPIRMTIHYDRKSLELVAEEFVRTVSFHTTSPNDIYIGRRQDDADQNSIVLEQGILYRATDGRAGYGHMERLLPGRLLKDPP